MQVVERKGLLVVMMEEEEEEEEEEDYISVYLFSIILLVRIYRMYSSNWIYFKHQTTPSQLNNS